MKTSSFLAWSLMIIVNALTVSDAFGRHFVSVKSSYLGDGWFFYQVRMEPNPFFSTQIMGLAGAAYFTNRIDNNSPPDGWTEDTNLATFTWTKNDQLEPHDLPFELTMMARSSSQGFRTDTNFYIAFLLWIHGWLQAPLLSENIAGYVRLAALVPCDPSQSDGSPSELFSSYELFPDPEVVGLGISSLSYAWPSENTVVIEASRDLQSWSNIAWIVGYGGTTTWYSVQPLETYGSSFRVGLVAMKALTNISQGVSHPLHVPPMPIFKRLTPEGLIIVDSGGESLIPAKQPDSPAWYLPVSVPP